MVVFDFKIVPGGQRIRRGFDRLGADIKNLKKIDPVVLDWFVKMERSRFDREGAFGDTRWAPLSPKYKKYKDRVRPGKRILQFDGDLYTAMTGGVGFHHVRSKARLEYGTEKVRYARFHQTGTRIMPARPPIRLTEHFLRKLRLAVGKHMVNQFRTSARGAGLKAFGTGATGARVGI